jgi:hypothetical protein
MKEDNASFSNLAGIGDAQYPRNVILCYAPGDKVHSRASLFVENPNSKSANRNILISVADLEQYSS